MSPRGDGKPPISKLDHESSIRSDERQRFARELHDTTSQTLVVLQLQLGRVRRCEVGNTEPLIQEAEETIRLIRENIHGLDLD